MNDLFWWATAVLSLHVVLSAIRGLLTVGFYRQETAPMIDDATHLHRLRPVVIVPLLNEVGIARHLIAGVRAQLSSRGIRTYLVVHASDPQTMTAYRALLSNDDSDVVVLVTNNERSISKASQINAALRQIDMQHIDLISIYDADSLIRGDVYDLISAMGHAQSARRIGAYQQAPFYPVIPGRFGSIPLAYGRAVYSLTYHYCYERPHYSRTGKRWALGMSTHLTGHGEHIVPLALKHAGGFQEPSCDSSLGFALSYLDYEIVPIPCPDVGQTPDHVDQIWYQGLRWYRGCDLYLREACRLGFSCKRIAQTLLTLWNNAIWALIWPVYLALAVVTEIRSPTVALYPALLLLLAIYIRHLLMYFAYRQLACFANKPETIMGLGTWGTELFVKYVVIRFAWCFVPWHHYARVALGRGVANESTPKRSL
jgi:cellulose synthase/poly-beta-1,6-N-acetylglucosamine synthase-like glycosyltransferase